jgi:hypothetical protein
MAEEEAKKAEKVQQRQQKVKLALATRKVIKSCE